MDRQEITSKHFKIAYLIYGNWVNERDPNTEFNKDRKASSERAKKLAQVSIKKLKEEKEHYYKTLKTYAAKQTGSRMSEVLPLDIYNPLISPSLSHADHPLRQAEERYLLVKYNIKDTGNSIQNWALIGMALTECGGEYPVNILFPQPKEKRGHRKSGFSIDYQRTVWKLFLEDAEVTIITADHEEFSFSGESLFTLNELLDVFLSELEAPMMESTLHAFQDINRQLKLKGVSRDTLITSFSRGEKERCKMWNY